MNAPCGRPTYYIQGYNVKRGNHKGYPYKNSFKSLRKAILAQMQ